VIAEFDAVHQLVPSVVDGDAVSAHSLQVQRLLRDLGLASEIYVQDVAASNAGHVHPLRSFKPGPRTALVYQLAIGSAVADELIPLAERGTRLVVNYHNLTPPDFFRPWLDPVTEPLAWGGRQLAKLAWWAGLGIGVSAFNERDLVACGYRRTAVAPILLDTDRFATEEDEATAARLQAARERGGHDWLFVGRIAPNKAQHDLVRAFALYRRTVDPEARLHLVGGSSSRLYRRMVRRLVAGLGLDGAVDLTGPVSSATLAAHYRHADVFVCLSDHEGFCVPLLEAFHHDLPVVAYDAGAVGETLGRGGVLLDDKSPAVVATAVERVLHDPALRAGLVAAGRARLADFSLDATRAAFRDALEQLPLVEPDDPDDPEDAP